MPLFLRLLPQFCLTLLGASSVAGQPADWRSEITPEQAIIMDGSDTVAVYQIAPRSRPDGSYARANYLHPVYAPDGSLLTEDFPADHFHHRGIFWAWHQVYAGTRRAGDGWECKNFSWDVGDVTIEPQGERLNLSATVTWRSRLAEGEAPIALAEEQLRIRFHPVRNGKRRIDFRIDIRPLVADLAIGGSEDAKGYGGFSWRLPLPEDIAFYTGKEQVQPQETAVAAGRNLRIAGTFDHSRREVTIRQQRQLGGVHPWILRKQSSMQNVAFPGRALFTIPRRGIRLEYRIKL